MRPGGKFGEGPASDWRWPGFVEACGGGVLLESPGG